MSIKIESQVSRNLEGSVVKLVKVWLSSLKSHSIRKYVYMLKRLSLLVLIHDMFF